MIEFEGVKIIEVRDSPTEPTGCDPCVFSPWRGHPALGAAKKEYGCVGIGEKCIERDTHFEEYHEFPNI